MSVPPHWRAGAGRLALPLAIFIGSFSWSFVFVSLPFHIQHISTWDPKSTLRWTGWILGVTALVTVITAPLWGRFGGRGDPKRLFMIVQALQGLGFLGMAACAPVPGWYDGGCPSPRRVRRRARPWERLRSPR